MSRSTLLAICVLAVLLLSSAANATLVWTNPFLLSGNWGVNPPVNAEILIPQYDPLLYGGADLQAVRFDLSTEMFPFELAVGNPSYDAAYGLATVSGAFEVFDPSAPGTVYAGTQHSISQWMSVPPWTLTSVSASEIPRSDVGIVTTNLTPFIGNFYSPVAIGLRTTDYSSWAGTEGAQLLYSLSGFAAVNVYYGYDDGTPARTPEPGTLLLMAAGLPALGFLRRRRRSAA
ncbi:MAG: PEP-CTERM sorting domain-containing protein [Armatimonadota bacterium]